MQVFVMNGRVLPEMAEPARGDVASLYRKCYSRADLIGGLVSFGPSAVTRTLAVKGDKSPSLFLSLPGPGQRSAGIPSIK